MKKYTTIIIFAIVFICIGALVRNLHKACDGLNCISFETKDDYTLVTTYETTANTFRGMWQNENVLLRADIRRNFSKEEADKLIQSKILSSDALYAPAPAPYPGRVTDTIVCDTSLRPSYQKTYVHDVTVSHATEYLNDRATLGVCEKKYVRYIGSVMQFYCPTQKTAYSLEFIAPSDQEQLLKTDSYLRTLKCN